MISIASFFNVKPYLTYSVLFPRYRRIEEDDIIRYIKNHDAEALLMSLSSLTRCNVDKIPYMEASFYGSFIPNNKIPTYNGKDRYILFTPQTLMVSMKWTILYGEFYDRNPLLENKSRRVVPNLNEAIFLSIMIADTMIEGIDHNKSIMNAIFPSMQRNAYFNSVNVNSFRYAIIRIITWYRELAGREYIKNDKIYFDIYNDFQTKFGYDIESYLSQIVMLYLYERIDWCNYFHIDFSLMEMLLESYTKSGRFDNYTINLKEARKKLRNEINDNFSLKFFWQYIFIRINSHSILSMNFEPYIYKTFTNFKFHIAQLYDGKDRQHCLEFLGKIQEYYIYDMIKNTIKDHRINVYPEMLFNSNTDKTPDAMVDIDGKVLLIFESKNQQVKEQALFHDDWDIYFKEEKRLAINPIQQMLKCLEKMNKSKSSKIKELNIQSFSHIYLFSVINDGFNMNPYLHPEIGSMSEKLISDSFFEKEIKGYFSVGIDHLEKIIAWLFSNQYKIRPKVIVHKLDSLYKEKVPINDYFHRHDIRTPTLSYLEEREGYLSEVNQEIIEMSTMDNKSK